MKDIIILAVIAILFVLDVRYMIKNKNTCGKSGCCGDCSQCRKK